MKQINPDLISCNDMTCSDKTVVGAFELHRNGQIVRVVLLGMGDIEGQQLNLQAVVVTTPDFVRGLALQLMDAADMAEGDCQLPRMTDRGLLS